jgi:glucokinase
MTGKQYIIAMDVGGSSVKSGLVDFDLSISHHAHTPIDSQGSADDIFNTLCAVIHLHQGQVENIVGVGFGFPGPCDYDKGIALIKDLEKFESIYGLNIGDELRARLNQPDLQMRFRNDAEAAIVGEAKYGAGKGYRRIIGITLGTGIGSGFVIDGVRVSSGKGVPNYNDGILNLEPFKGERADDIFSTRGLLARFAKAGLSFAHNSEAKAAADNGDVAVRQVFAEFGADLGAFLTPYVREFEADIVLISGGIAGAMDYFRDALVDNLPVSMFAGTLGADAALIGAAELFLGAED